MSKRLNPLFLLLVLASSLTAKSIHYTLSMPEPHTHLFEVEMRLEGSGSKEVVALPVWTPGSYLVREYAKNVQDVEALAENGKSLPIRKLDKNHWEVNGRRGSDIIIKYKVYSFEKSVRTSYLDSDHALVVPASVLMYWQKNQDRTHKLHVDLPENWETITTSLKPFHVAGNRDFTAVNYDELADSPLQLGNHHEIEFEVRGKPHVLGIYGSSNYIDSVLVPDFTKIMEAEADIYGGLPYEHYAFIVHVGEARGGLEHASSSVNFINRWSFNDPKRYHSFLALISHEFFHLWNVKRIYPQGIARFDYDKENYLDELWVVEGFTSYYDELILQRTGLTNRQDYLEIIKDEINILESRPGRFHQSVAASSFDTWIKYYRPNEHSHNATISYYNKGHLLGLLLDLKIIAATSGKAGLDDVMLRMYRDFALKEKGYTSDDVRLICEQISGLELKQFFADYVHGVEPLPYRDVLNLAGVVMDSTAEKSAWTGVRLRNENGHIMITSILEDSPAWDAGLNVNDELIAIDGFRVKSSSPAYLSEKIPGDRIIYTVSRNGILRDIHLTVGFTPVEIKELKQVEEATDAQHQVFERWLEPSAQMEP